MILDDFFPPLILANFFRSQTVVRLPPCHAIPRAVVSISKVAEKVNLRNAAVPVEL